MPLLTSFSYRLLPGSYVEWQPTSFPLTQAVIVEVEDFGPSRVRRIGYLGAVNFFANPAGRFIRAEEGLGAVWTASSTFWLSPPRQLNAITYQNNSFTRLNSRLLIHLYSA